jgi:UDPglucose--hexose-1-phosphate uridylyltransferase
METPTHDVTDLRFDELSGAAVLVSPNRQSRPNLPTDGCPFCVGGLEAPEAYTTRAFPNRWPPFTAGRAEILLYTPDHDRSLWELGRHGVARVVDLWADRTEALGARDDVDYVLVFENRGAEVGATIDHPHGQVYGLETIAEAPLAELRRAARHGCSLCQRPRAELIVAEEDGWTAWVPHASAYPYGLLLAPDVHRPDLPSLDGPQRDALAALLADVLGRFDRLFDMPLPYMLWIHQRPTDGAPWPEAHVHIHLVSPLRGPGVMRYVAAGELGSGLFLNPVRPEDAAAALRALGPLGAATPVPHRAPTPPSTAPTNGS